MKKKNKLGETLKEVLSYKKCFLDIENFSFLVGHAQFLLF